MRLYAPLTVSQPLTRTFLSPSFVYRYMIVMDSEEANIKVKMAAHFKDLMSNAQCLCLVVYQCISWGLAKPAQAG